jgi:hypothetical protein
MDKWIDGSVGETRQKLVWLTIPSSPHLRVCVHAGGVPRAGEGPLQCPGLRGRGASMCMCIIACAYVRACAYCKTCNRHRRRGIRFTAHAGSPQTLNEIRLQDYTLRTQLFEVLRGEGSYKEAATVLAGLNLDSVSRCGLIVMCRALSLDPLPPPSPPPGAYDRPPHTTSHHTIHHIAHHTIMGWKTGRSPTGRRRTST